MCTNVYKGEGPLLISVYERYKGEGPLLISVYERLQGRRSSTETRIVFSSRFPELIRKIKAARSGNLLYS